MGVADPVGEGPHIYYGLAECAQRVRLADDPENVMVKKSFVREISQ